MVGSGIRDPEKTYSGSRIRGAKRYRIPDPQHWEGCWEMPKGFWKDSGQFLKGTYRKVAGKCRNTRSHPLGEEEELLSG